MQGKKPHTELFDHEPGNKAPDVTKEELQRALADRDEHLLKLLTRDNSGLEVGDVLGITEKEVEAGKVLGGDAKGHWYVWLDEQGQVKHNVPLENWLPMLRFPRVQLKPDTSYEVRPIDDCTGGGLNWSIAVVDKMVMDNLRSLRNTALYVHELWGRSPDNQADPALGVAEEYKPVWAKGDHEKAYRQWPVHPEDQPLLATLVWDIQH